MQLFIGEFIIDGGIFRFIENERKKDTYIL